MKRFLQNGYSGQITPLMMLEGDAGDGGQGGAAPEAPKMVDFKDPVTGNMVKIPAELSAVIGHVITKTRTDTEGKYKPIVDQFEAEKTDFVAIKAEYQKLKEESMTAEEKAQANAKRVIEEHQKTTKLAVDEAQTWKQRFEKSTLRTDIMSSFGDMGSKLCNAEQAATLLQIEGNAKISEIISGEGKPTGEFETRVTLMLEDKDGKPELVEGTPKELFKRWIQLERNSHHVINTLPAGSGNRGGGNRPGVKDYSHIENPIEKMKAFRAAK